MQINFPQLNKTISAAEGETILDVLKRSGIMFDAPCGGKKRCKKCRVTVTPAHECKSAEFLSLAEYTIGVRLACFYKPQGDCSVTFKSGNDTASDGTAGGSGNGATAAIDVGTTTVAAEIFGADKKLLSTAFLLNPQKPYGADVISRINACNEGKLDILRELILSAVGKFKSGAERLYIAANTAMLHIIAGVSPKSIGEAPYVPVFTNTREYSFKELGIDGCGTVVLMPSAGAFIGADVVAGVLSSGMFDSSENSLLIDLGTNGEIVLKAGGKYYAASTAAGPAFEGGNISCGSYASPSAAASARLDKQNNIIFDKPDASTVCGAGLIDLLACLLKRGDVEGSGAITDGNEVKINNIVLTQKDIRELQLGKAAVYAGIKTLLKTAGIDASAISAVYLAGGFGKGLNPSSAAAIGLIPKEFETRTIAVGNSSLSGAVMCALDEKHLKICEKIARSIQLTDLTQNPEFFDFYTEAMVFEDE